MFLYCRVALASRPTFSVFDDRSSFKVLINLLQFQVRSTLACQ